LKLCLKKSVFLCFCAFLYFSMRKIKFTQQTISERLGNIIHDFPRLNDIHPFYADLCNTLYDRDHYKLALGQLNAAKGLVEQISRDMIRMVKYGDSLYRCKCLKRAALGRMCTVLKRQKASLAYLEEVRKHLSRLPALDPNTRTLLLCGLPNVGKSSFLNKVTRGNVEVQPYAFTTKSLFVGHTDYKYLRWQVIDTPGILDHPLEERNTIEMQSIIALAHLTCAVLYIMDISEHCGYTIEQQCRLFQGIKPLFANKQLIIVVNKVDQQPWETLEADKKEMIENLVKQQGGVNNNCSLMTMSNITEHGVSQVKNAACEKLLEARVDARVASNKVDSVMNRLQVFQPQPRDNVHRDVCIPDSVREEIQANGGERAKPQKSRTGYAPTVEDTGNNAAKDDVMTDAAFKKTARDLMWENGGPGVWAPDYRAIYDLKEDEWKFDCIPEIMNGKNIADFVDPDIEAKLAALEFEEEQVLAELDAANMEDQESDLESEEEAAVYAIRDRKKIIRGMKHFHQTQNRPMMPREVRGRRKDCHDPGTRDKKAIQERMGQLGVDASKLIERGRSLDRDVRKRGRSLTRRDEEQDERMDDAEPEEGQSKTQRKKARREREESRKRDPSVNKRTHDKPLSLEKQGLNEDKKVMAKKMERLGRKGWNGGAGEGDNRKGVHLVQWMNTGKKRNGTHYCR
jgi:nucleolar GTP-binding protein